MGELENYVIMTRHVNALKDVARFSVYLGVTALAIALVALGLAIWAHF